MNCSTCKTRCRLPESCHLPEDPQPLAQRAPKRAPDFQPTYDLRGPYRLKRRPNVPVRAIAGFCGLAVLLAVVFLFLYR